MSSEPYLIVRQRVLTRYQTAIQILYNHRHADLAPSSIDARTAIEALLHAVSQGWRALTIDRPRKWVLVRHTRSIKQADRALAAAMLAVDAAGLVDVDLDSRN
ncbi:hypothetical protein KQI63_09595 [bacterium]|nr:hypothetical protein [bacterium]